jgi:signal transduction histidine kinase
MTEKSPGFIPKPKLQGKFLLFFGSVSLIFVIVFHLVSYLGSRNIMENVVQSRIENDLQAIKLQVNTSLNATVNNILEHEAETLQKELEEAADLRSYYRTLESAAQRLGSRRIQLVALEGLGEKSFPHSPHYPTLWHERDYHGNYYIQEIISTSSGEGNRQIQNVSHLNIVNGQHRILIHSYFFVPSLEKVIILSAVRSDYLHSFSLEDIRDAVVAFQFGKWGSIELFNRENIQLIHTARQFESTIRQTDLHDKVIRMRNGNTAERIPLTDLNSTLYISPSAEKTLQREEISMRYSFDWIPDIGWFIVHGAAETEILQPVNNLMVISLSVAILFFLTLLILTYLSTDTIFIKRLNVLSDAVQKFQERNFDSRAEVSGNDEVSELSRSFNSMASEIQVYANELESLVEHRTEELVQAEKMAALGSLVAGVAHEINTPLGIGVTSSSHILERIHHIEQSHEEEKFTKEEFKSFLRELEEIAGILQTSMGQASKLINSFKNIAVDQTNDEIREFELVSYLSEIILGLKPNLKRSNARVEVSGLYALRLNCSPGLFYQIFSNLILNSIHHGFTESANDNRIEINLSLDEKALHISYQDNGKGIPKEDQKRIFEPFFTTKRGQGGSGLGLHIIYTIVTGQFGGKIILKSSKSGVIFQISIGLDRIQVLSYEP